MLPHPQNQPPQADQDLIGFPITSPVPGDLVPPEVGVSPGRSMMIRTPMPKTAVDHHRHPGRRKHDIRRSPNRRHRTPTDPVPKTTTMKLDPNPQLRNGIPTTDATHPCANNRIDATSGRARSLRDLHDGNLAAPPRPTPTCGRSRRKSQPELHAVEPAQAPRRTLSGQRSRRGADVPRSLGLHGPVILTFATRSMSARIGWAACGERAAGLVGESLCRTSAMPPAEVGATARPSQWSAVKVGRGVARRYLRQ